MGKAVLPLSIYSNFSNYQTGDISGAKFGLSTSIGVYSAYAGPGGWLEELIWQRMHYGKKILLQ
jgi:hypothetical protein